MVLCLVQKVSVLPEPMSARSECVLASDIVDEGSCWWFCGREL